MSAETHACPRCRFANLAERRFCARCGAVLGEACCGFRNQAADAFCGGCGRARALPEERSDLAQPVAMAEILAEAAVESQAHERAERRLVHLDQRQLDKLFEG